MFCCSEEANYCCLQGCPVPSFSRIFLDETHCGRLHSMFEVSLVVEYLPEHVANLLCLICCDVLNEPIELACGSLVCALCCCTWIELSSKTSCPGCYTHELDNLTISLPSAVVYELLGALKLVCSTCKGKRPSEEEANYYKTDSTL